MNESSGIERAPAPAMLASRAAARVRRRGGSAQVEPVGGQALLDPIAAHIEKVAAGPPPWGDAPEGLRFQWARRIFARLLLPYGEPQRAFDESVSAALVLMRERQIEFEAEIQTRMEERFSSAEAWLDDLESRMPGEQVGDEPR